MEQDIKLGSVGDLDISFAGGKASVKVSVAAALEAAGLAVSGDVVVSLDASALVDKLFAAIEKASPAGVVPFEEGAKAALKDAVSKL